MNEFGGCLYLELLNCKNTQGGYFENYQKNRVDVDSGRSAIQWILETKNYRRIWMPIYNCPLVLQRIMRTSNIEICLYNIDKDFTPCIEKRKYKQGDLLMWVNYCGVMDESTIDKVLQIKEETGTEIIIDNIPAYFERPRMNAINIYSCRKFLGVPDGGHVIGNEIEHIELPKYSTAKNYLYLIEAIESGSNYAYGRYKESEKRFEDANIAFGMPILTNKVLKLLDYENIKKKRKKNFKILHKILGESNSLSFNVETDTPSVYPYLTSDKGLRKKLLDSKVYISQFWKHVLTNDKANAFEKKLAEYLIPLPIDQRYTEEDMSNLANIVKKMED